METSIDEVAKTLDGSGSDCCDYIFAFLGSSRAMLIPLVTIPLSPINNVPSCWAVGFSINPC
ncbi:hypothetical protein O9929_26320 [Vibrio lentus]|nr:hypothetical protein [Vibrio lentus]